MGIATKRRPRPSNILQFAGTRESHTGQTRSCGTAFYFEPNGPTDQPIGTKTATLAALCFFFCSRILADLTKLVSFNEKIRNRTNSRCAIDGIYRQTNGKLDRSIDAFESVSSPSPSAFVRPSKIGCASLFLFVPSINRQRPRCLGCGRADNSN